MRDAVCEKVGGGPFKFLQRLRDFIVRQAKKEELTALMDQIALLKQAVNSSTNKIF